MRRLNYDVLRATADSGRQVVKLWVERNEDSAGVELTWVLVLECCQIVDILIDDNVQVFPSIMRRNVGGSEGLSHLVCRVSFAVWCGFAWSRVAVLYFSSSDLE